MSTKKQPKVFSTITIAGKRIDLCRIFFSQRLSEETYHFQAQLWVDGVHLCDVGNEGRGGPDHHDPVGKHTYNDIRALNAFCKENVPAEEFQGMMLESSLEAVTADLVTDWLMNKDLDKLLSTNFPIFDPDRGVVISFKGKIPPGPARDQVRAQVARDYPKAIILVDIPREEAMVLYKKKRP